MNIAPVQGAPERIWADNDMAWHSHDYSEVRPSVEYVRADKVRELEAEVARQAETLKFVARWAWRTDPPNSNSKLTDTERLSAIKYHPHIKPLAEPHIALEAAEARLAPEGVAVAWRWQTKKNLQWVYLNRRPTWLENEPGFVVEPLYAHPASDTALREALGRIASNGFGFPLRSIDPKRDREMLAMMDCARATLNPTSEKNNG